MRLPRRRRLKALTDYKLRFGLLKSGKPRLVIRKTNRYIIAQIIESDIAQDKVIVGTNSKNLIANGWPKEYSGKLKSLPAAYLTGNLIAKQALKKGVKKAILDIGMNRNIQKSRIYALLKGAVEAGLDIPCNKDCFPEIDIKDQKIKTIFEKIKTK